MKKRENSNLKFLSNFYYKLKERRLKDLEQKIQNLKEEIEKEKLLKDRSAVYLDKLLEENKALKEHYEQQVKLLAKRNNTITLKNNNYNVKQWENLTLAKIGSNYAIQTKAMETLYVFEDDMKDFLQLLQTLDYSIIVLSVDSSRVVIQFRIKEN
ncbi:hypothetical protein N3C_2025 [Clostridium sp. N3C]|uniref:hypothetical protein n=1 Tax=Clostridium sp. N3C TaxID=1776758 RepID=UPI00092DF91D|nr:hypothetical protein [Clostridium sp. N3C]SCN24884.1 hypothetical protein N3C_2025 [Clostridium sp. N3C]